ncbi:DUF2513 domain-containing protein [Staphylococcus xylosus]
MELKQDCLRDVLLTIEDMDYTLEGLLKEDFEKTTRMQKYKSIEVLYTLKLLSDANFINVEFGNGELFFVFYNVHSMNYQGHQLLDSIRDDKVWKKTKEKASKLSSVPISVLQQIATSITKEILGLP